ncbi:MAG TPA: PfkB family carbohydrate kinase, partial [Saprospiraceae bacterium]|nr:PfkB family carbohydrate kinase [Saprospiraceae bacterium]
DEIKLVSIVGGDFPSDEMENLRRLGVDLEGLEIKQNGKTFFWEGRYHQNMISRDTLVTDLNVLDDFNPVLPESFKKASFVMLGNLTPSLQEQVLDQLDNPEVFIALDTMNFWMDMAMDKLLEVIRRVDVLVINDEEARQLSGEFALSKAALKILNMGPKYLVIKKGEHGSLLFYNEKIFFAPGLPLSEVVDPTGAGDTFAGGFMGYLSKTGDTGFENMKRAIIYGSAMASFCVEEFSLDGIKNLSKDEIENRVRNFSELVDFSL